MSPLLTLLSASALNALLSAIWQGAILAVCVGLPLKLLPGITAQVRSVLWMAVFVLAVALHFVPAAHASAPHHALHAAPAWSVALAGLWITLSLFRATQFIVGAIRLRQIASHAKPVPNQPPTLSHSRSYLLCTSSDVDRPSVLGFWSPRILLPPGLLEILTPAELHQVLLHETAHVNRADDWTNLFQKLALVLFPLNPVLFWVERRLCLERELACDDRVLSSAGTRKSYATCLTQIAEHGILRRGLTLALGAWTRQSELSARVHRILRRPHPLLSPAHARLASGALLAGLLTAAVIMARVPRLIDFAQPVTPQFASRTPDTFGPAAPSADWAVKSQLVKETLPAGLQPGFSMPAIARPAAHPAQLLPLSLKHRKPKPQAARLVSFEPANPLILPQHESPAAFTITYRYRQIQPIYATAIWRVPAYAAVATPDGWIILEL